MGGLLLIYIFRRLLVVFSFLGFVSLADHAHAAKYAAVVVDGATGKVLHAENAYERRHPASLAKKMTLYLVFEALKAGRINLNTHFKTSHLATRQIPCKLSLRKGDTISVESIIKGMVTKSANDASVVIAEGLAGNLPSFIQLMNKKAKQLGMNATQFFNPSGVPDSRQITTAMDMAILAQALYRDFPEYCHYFKTKRFSYLGVSHNNHNHMLGNFPGLDGIKTGFVCASGFNISTSAIRYDANNNPRRLFAVVMGGENRHVRDRRAAQLLETNFRKIGASSVVKLSKPHTVPGTKGALKMDKEITPADTDDDDVEVQSTVAAQHSPLGPSPEVSVAKADQAMLEASLKQQEVAFRPSPAQQLESQLVQVATEQSSANHQSVQATPMYMHPGYQGYTPSNVQVPIVPIQVIPSPQPAQMVSEVTRTPLYPTEKVTTLVDSSINNGRSLPENWVVPKAPANQAKSSLAPSKVSSVKKFRHSAKKGLKKSRSGKRRVV